MIISETVGNTVINVGEVSVNHIKLVGEDEQTIVIHYGEWQEMIKLVDKMFKMLNDHS